MSSLFSSDHRTILFRKLWIALAKEQGKLGLPISQKQISEMEKHCNTIDSEKIDFYEKKFRHDVMAHIHAFGDLCPSAKPIIHLGATSCYATDNADLIITKEALSLLLGKLTQVIQLLASFAKKHAKAPCLSFTHYQPAQPTTIGKRASLWLQDLLMDGEAFETLLHNLPFLGAKGATGTQSSFLSLFQGNTQKLHTLEKELARTFGFQKTLKISGQTYTRKLDLILGNSLASFAASAHKIATDIRLLAHDNEILESFDKNQVGSSAMPYKRNPIYSERICGIARFVISLSQNPIYTTATQWLERTLDDSSNRRLSIPELCLGTDALLNLLIHLFSSLTPQPTTSLQRLEAYLPNLSLENILMAAVKKGGDRQLLHEKLRKLSFTAAKEPKPMAFLTQMITQDKAFKLSPAELKPLYDTKVLIGAAPEQVAAFLKEEVTPFLLRNKKRKVPLSKVEL